MGRAAVIDPIQIMIFMLFVGLGWVLRKHRQETRREVRPTEPELVVLVSNYLVNRDPWDPEDHSVDDAAQQFRDALVIRIRLRERRARELDERTLPWG
jgi:hypothetical protein